MISASDLGKFPRIAPIKVRRNLVTCAGVDATKTLPARSCSEVIVGCGAPDRRYRCESCKKEQKRRWDAINNAGKTKQETEAPLTPADLTARGNRFRELDELIAASGEHPGNWRGSYRPDWEFAGGMGMTPLARFEAQDVEGRRTYRR